MLLGPRVIDIVRRFDIAPPNAPSLVPIGGVQTSPMKLAQAYAALENGGVLPKVRFLSAVIGPRGNLVGRPARKEGPRVMSSSTASTVLQALRGPVKRGTARGANSAHALVYGKTGTSSRNEDALFVGLTQDFVGSIWLGHDRPQPMPGVHGGGTPAKAFSKMTDFYYVRQAQTRLTESEALVARGSPWVKLKVFAARQPGTIAMIALGSLVTLCFVLPALFRRRERPVKPATVEPPHEDRDVQHQQYQQAPLQSS